MMINLKFDLIFFKYTLKSSYLSAGLYKMFTLILHGYTSKSLSISSLGTAGAQAHDFPHYFLCLLPSLIFSATIHPHLIRIIRRRRRREALSLKEGTKLFVSLSWNMPSIDASLVGWWSSIFISSSSVGSPAAQVHDGPQRLLWLLGLLVSHSARNHGGRGRRELLGLRKGPEVVLGMLVNRPQSVIPSAEALVLECLHCSHTCCHYPSFPHMTLS